tara:strand:+ start:9506 stop:9964 length:459 start_codon:yes stop_codon:yes gene_type:complete
MNRGLGKFLTLFFAACFLALQFHPVAEIQSELNDKRIFHIEEVSVSIIDKNIDNRFIYVQQLASKQAYLPPQKIKLTQQRQYLSGIERQLAHPFRVFMLECLDAICKNYQDKLTTSFIYQQKRKLSFELDPILISNNIQVHIDESDLHVSLS